MRPVGVGQGEAGGSLSLLAVKGREGVAVILNGSLSDDGGNHASCRLDGDNATEQEDGGGRRGGSSGSSNGNEVASGLVLLENGTAEWRAQGCGLLAPWVKYRAQYPL